MAPALQAEDVDVEESDAVEESYETLLGAEACGERTTRSVSEARLWPSCRCARLRVEHSAGDGQNLAGNLALALVGWAL